MTGIARIGDDQGRMALLVNGGHPRRGEERILSPIGGSFRYRPVGRTHLTALGATDFEGDLEIPAIPDLRFRVADNKIEGVVSWFKLRSERELTVDRQLTRTLTQRAQVLRADHLRNYRGGYAGSFRHNAVTTGTVHLIEMFDVALDNRAISLLKAAARANISRRLVHLATPAEIEAGITRDGVRINPISRYVI
jgi:hypothetical protein